MIFRYHTKPRHLSPITAIDSSNSFTKIFNAFKFFLSQRQHFAKYSVRSQQGYLKQCGYESVKKKPRNDYLHFCLAVGCLPVLWFWAIHIRPWTHSSVCMDVEGVGNKLGSWTWRLMTTHRRDIPTHTSALWCLEWTSLVASHQQPHKAPPLWWVMSPSRSWKIQTSSWARQHDADIKGDIVVTAADESAKTSREYRELVGLDAS